MTLCRYVCDKTLRLIVLNICVGKRTDNQVVAGVSCFFPLKHNSPADRSGIKGARRIRSETVRPQESGCERFTDMRARRRLVAVADVRAISPNEGSEIMMTSKKISTNYLSAFSPPAHEVAPDLVCLSHLRWDFVYQRPQHLLSRFAGERRVFVIEEPVFLAGPAHLDVSLRECGVTVVVPRLPVEINRDMHLINAGMQKLLVQFFAEQQITEHILWYYTPMALDWARNLPRPLAAVYDCMDELTAFKGAPPALKNREAELFDHVDLVFTGGQSLYEAKRQSHKSVYAFPSSIDAHHFARARAMSEDMSDAPADQRNIPHPRLGFFGVIDERLDVELLDGIAVARPHWHFVMIGPIVKIAVDDLPRRANIHYLGAKPYADLPSYLAGWDVALLPFARNESTRFISPTKTPEYLAAGRPVVSTSIQDVVRPYGERGLVRIADTTEGFVAAIEAALNEDKASASVRLRAADAFLSRTSWDRTWARMNELIEDAIAARRTVLTKAKSLVAGAATRSAGVASNFNAGD